MYRGWIVRIGWHESAKSGIKEVSPLIDALTNREKKVEKERGKWKRY